MLSRRWVTAAAVVGAAVFLSAAPELWAAQMRRPQLAVAVTTKGIQGQIMSAGGTTHMLYPSNLKRPGAYGNNKLYETFQYNAYYMRIRAGHGVWSFTSDAKVVYTGPRFDYNDQIEAMQYEVDLDPDYKDVGYGGDIEEGGIPYIQYVPTA